MRGEGRNILMGEGTCRSTVIDVGSRSDVDRCGTVWGCRFDLSSRDVHVGVAISETVLDLEGT